MNLIEQIQKDNFYYITLANSKFIKNSSCISKGIKFCTNKIKIENSLDKPLIILNYLKPENNFLPSFLTINISNNSKIDLLEVFICNEKTETFMDINRVFKINKNSHLDYSRIIDTKSFSIIDSKSTAKLKKGAFANIVTFNSNAKTQLNIFNCELKKTNSSINIYGLVDIEQKQHVENIINITHNKEFTNSSIAFRHLLNDFSSAVFNANTTINNSAPNSKAFQKSQSTLLSDDAKINALPKLQIYIDELEARHSATTGLIDEEQMYYLQSKGISKQIALNMILNSFKLETIDKIESVLIKKFIQEYKGIDDV